MAVVTKREPRDSLPANHPLNGAGVLILDYVHPSSLGTEFPAQRAMTPEEEATEEALSNKYFANRNNRKVRGVPLTSYDR